MWYHPAAFTLGKRDVIAAWLVCLAISAASFGLPTIERLIDAIEARTPSAGTAPSGVSCHLGAKTEADHQG
jgi:hypothetical protein